MKKECNLRDIIKKLLEFYDFNPKPEDFLAIKAIKEGMHPFGILVSIILTQNTSDKNALRALKNLRMHIDPDLNPAPFKNIKTKNLAELIKPSGMQLIKAKTIKNVLRTLTIKELDTLLEIDPETLKEKLIAIKGVGPKTTDVFLLMARKYPTFPVDTHIRRVLARLGCINKGEEYRSIRKKVIGHLGKDPALLHKAHIILITHGRKVCTARSPKCNLCPLKQLCDYYNSQMRR